METLKTLSLDLTVVSVISIVLFGVLPDENDYRSLLKYVAELLSATLVVTCLFTMINADLFKFDFEAGVNNQAIEEYILEKNTTAYLKDIEKSTAEIFKRFNVNCSKIEVVASEDVSLLKFYVDQMNNQNQESLSKELSKITQVKCLVIVGGYDE